MGIGTIPWDGVDRRNERGLLLTASPRPADRIVSVNADFEPVRYTVDRSSEPAGGVHDRYHGSPFEVVIPCSSIDEANAEKADLHVAAEARAFIRPGGVGVTLTSAEAARAAGWYFQQADDIIVDDEDRALVARLEAAAGG